MTISERLKELGSYELSIVLPLVADVVEADEALVGYTRLVLDSHVARPELEAAMRKSKTALAVLRKRLSDLEDE